MKLVKSNLKIPRTNYGAEHLSLYGVAIIFFKTYGKDMTSPKRA